ncbi:hypothetical protein GGI59_002036 [Rhizobium lentis]|uniref:Uncharacterized protein n=1 Tax=Rhizobium lentis TaxID=1138194 RepID=A0A7W8UP67_9HYPH|nr:hypothetical protein [Rhizobium lentis]MBB5560385.1 hypothetical protein [Rhizobium lentis]
MVATIGRSPPRAFQHVGDDFFRAAVAIDVGRIDEGHAGIERGIQRRTPVRLADIAP